MEEATVLITNIGAVFTGTLDQAIKEYKEYVELSQGNHGRAAGESITIYYEDRVYKEHIGSNYIIL